MLDSRTGSSVAEQKLARCGNEIAGAVLRSVGQGICALDRRGRITLVNPAAEQLLGWSEDELLGKDIHDTLHFQAGGGTVAHPKTCPLKSPLRSGQTMTVDDDVFACKDGAVLPVAYTASPTKTGGAVTGVAIAFRDTSNRRRVIAAADRLARLQAVTAALSEALTPSQVAQVMVDQGIAALGASAGSLALLVDQSHELEIVHSVGYAEVAVEQNQRLSLDAPVLLAQVVQKGQPIWLSSSQAQAGRSPKELAAHRRLGHESAAAIPLEVEGRTLGAIGLSFAQPREFDHDDQAFILALAQQCAQALERAQLYQAERQAREERDAMIQSLRESEARFRCLVEANIICVYAYFRHDTSIGPYRHELITTLPSNRHAGAVLFSSAFRPATISAGTTEDAVAATRKGHSVDAGEGSDPRRAAMNAARVVTPRFARLRAWHRCHTPRRCSAVYARIR